MLACILISFALIAILLAVLFFAHYSDYLDFVKKAKSRGKSYSEISFDDFLTLYKKKTESYNFKLRNSYYYDLLSDSDNFKFYDENQCQIIRISKSRVELDNYSLYFSFIDYQKYLYWFKQEQAKLRGNVYDPTIIDKLKGDRTE